MERNSALERNKSWVCYRWPGADMSLILMHFYVSPFVQRDAWRNQDEIPQWFPFALHQGVRSVFTDWCILKVSSNLWSVYYIEYKSVLFFIRSCLLCQSWISLPCGPFAVAVIVTCILLHFIYRHFHCIFAYSCQSFYKKKWENLFFVLKLFWQWLVYLTKQCEIMSWGFCLQ